MARDPLSAIGNRPATAHRQTTKARSDQVVNKAGGYVFEISDESKLLRFLILGTTGGTYYSGEQAMTKEVTREITKVMDRMGTEFVDIVRDVSLNGRAPKQQPTLWCLALAATATHADGSPNSEIRTAAYSAVTEICRTGTMLFGFMSYTRNFLGGNGRGFRNAVGRWYNDRDVDKLARQIAKYGQREGFSHRDVLRLAHPKPIDAEHNDLYRWVTGKGGTENALITAAETAKRSEDPKEVIALINEFRLEREMINSVHLKNPKVWEALLPNMGLTAVIRNLGAMTAAGLITPNSAAEKQIAQILGDAEAIRRSRIHPFNALVALRVYGLGRAVRGELTWKPTRRIIDTLDDLFYTSFGNVEGTGNDTLLALDVSGSMGSPIMNNPVISCRDASAAMAMVVARTEPNFEVIGFTGGSSMWGSRAKGYGPVTELQISPKQRLDDVIKTISGLPFGSTDCSLPFTWSLENKRRFANFAVFTDNETYAGAIHPFEALKQYRNKTGLAARSVVVGMTAFHKSIADPRDPGMLDVVGFDSAAPQLIADFWSGRV